MIDNKWRDNARSHLGQIELSMNHTLDILEQVSHQFNYPRAIALNLSEYLETEDVAKRTSLKEQVQQELEYISYTNSNIGLTAYIDENGESLFHNVSLTKRVDVNQMQPLYQYDRTSFFGPHMSNSRLHSQMVISMVREIDLPSDETIYIYLESHYTFGKSLVQRRNEEGNNSFYLILDDQGRIAYSELSSLFPRNSAFHENDDGSNYGVTQNYYWFLETNNHGWSVVSLIPLMEFNKEKNTWMKQIFLLAIVFGVLSILIALLVWKMVYKPLRQFDHEIVSISSNNFHSKADQTYIKEFDDVLEQLQRMKKQIKELIAEVEDKEKNRADLEIEKLMYQINPHFLMNTLNTVHWLAMIKQQDEIDHVVTSLNRLLAYNLRRGKVSTIEEELDSLRQYCNLQEMRYQFSFYLEIQVPQKALKTKVPKFILQPIVENAIYHGLDDSGAITVTVHQVFGYIHISVHDNGIGFPKEEIHKMLYREEKSDKGRIGIGMNYVRRMLESFYQKEAEIQIDSEEHKGTTVTLILPLEKTKQEKIS